MTAKPTSLADTLSLFKETLKKRQKYVKSEHQAYGLQLAEELQDWRNRSLYIRLAKTTDRSLLETARLFIKDQLAGTVKSKAKLFMWKLADLKKTRV